MVLKVRLADSQALEGLLARIYDVPGVRGTRTYVVLSTYLERTTQAGITADLADPVGQYGDRLQQQPSGPDPA